MKMLRFVFAVLAVTITAQSAGAAESNPFANWAAVVIAGDWHSQGTTPSTAFDNARREVTKRLLAVGFTSANLRQMSARPDLYPDPNIWHADGRSLESLLKQLMPNAPGGCLIYWTAHGNPDGAVMDTALLAPGGLALVLDHTCKDKPTIVIISACYSGVFIPVLQAPNRMILTAARPDRSSFGCGVDNVYPYFDECILTSFPASHDFPALGAAAQACVAAREQREKLTPPSEPQMSVGPEIASLLAQAAFPAMAPTP